MDYKKMARELFETLHEIRSPFDKEKLSKYGKGENMVIGLLFKNGGCIGNSEISKYTRVSTARIAAVLNSLEEKGMIRRIPVNGDRRKTDVVLTDQGKALALTELQEICENGEKLLNYLGEEDAKNLLRILQRINTYFSQQRSQEDSNSAISGSLIKKEEKNN